MRLAVFVVLQALLWPLALVGGPLAGYRELIVSRREGVSFTAGQVIQIHWIMHHFGTREDEATARFIARLPIESHWGLWATLSAALLANRVCGYTPKFAQQAPPGHERVSTFMPTRLLQCDRLARAGLQGVQQAVLLGAGFDLRLQELTRGTSTRLFELDLEATQCMKRETLRAAGLDHAHVVHVPIDFRTEDWAEKLCAAGFDPTLPTYFHWESVNIYLEEEVVRQTLAKISELSASGSTLVHDYYSKFLVEGGTKNFKRATQMVAKMGEPWLFGVDMSGDVRAEISALLQDFGLTLEQLVTVGGEGGEEAPWYAIAEAKKP